MLANAPQARDISDREHPRYAHEAAVTLRGPTWSIEGRTRNVSRGGLCATLADPVAVGTDLDVDIVLVFDDEVQSEALRLPARAVWCTSVDDAHQVGLAFRVLSAEAGQYLTMFLRYLDGDKVEKANRRVPEIDDRFR
jgi:hypothetical protein